MHFRYFVSKARREIKPRYDQALSSWFPVDCMCAWIQYAWMDDVCLMHGYTGLELRTPVNTERPLLGTVDKRKMIKKGEKMKREESITGKKKVTTASDYSRSHSHPLQGNAPLVSPDGSGNGSAHAVGVGHTGTCGSINSAKALRGNQSCLLRQ